MPVALALGTFLSTLAGGAFALRHRDRLHVVLGFSAGSRISVTRSAVTSLMLSLW